MKRRDFLKIAMISALAPTTGIKLIAKQAVPVYGYTMKWLPLRGSGVSGNSTLEGGEEVMRFQCKVTFDSENYGVVVGERYKKCQV